MKAWSKGELGLMWLGVGAALVVTAPIWANGLLTVVAVVLGVVALVYGGLLSWQGVRKSPLERTETSEAAGTDAQRGEAEGGPADQES
ncbi:hypothetical protein RN607_10110 [Demequina capsici]|uniref:Uncharacterized protein n=1 Tax=Demequina capsici TaxID=3075620 RepID=A0AA96JC80_9MICO|nr:hypothetical protein [Demequina sp. PMTSA13]WNM26551.1 hypothetical protein RN607_10110 [Demequina sp. PMTSA13]